MLQPLKIREKDEYEKVLALQADLIVTAAFGQIVPNEILEAPKYGCINVHASLLPELRGGAPIHYSIMQGKEKTGITIMYMVEKLDAGDILTQVEVEIEERETTGSLFDKLSEAGSHLLSKTVPLLLQGKLEPIKQNNEEATFAYNIKREQEKIDWTKTGEEVYNHIRGLNPWPVAYTTLAGQVVKVWWGEKVLIKEQAEAGTIIAVEEDGFVVKTGNETAIKITELQPSGKKRMNCAQFLRGTKPEIGTKLGEEA